MTTEKPKRKTKRRGNGEGSIFQRADGRWVARLSIGFGTDGKRRTKTVYGKTKTEVQQKLTKLQGQKINGTLGHADKSTLGEYLESWLENVARKHVKESTLNAYRSAVRAQILPHLGGLKLANIRPEHILAMHAAIERNSGSARQQQVSHIILNRMYKHARKTGAVAVNPLDAVDMPKYELPEIHPLSAEQARTFLQAVQGDWLECLYILAITTGARHGELLALQWRDVDLDAGFISIRYTLFWRGKEPVLTKPKTKSSRRKIDLPAMAVEALHEHRARMMANGHAGSEFVFVNRRGKPIRSTSVVYSMRSIVQDINARLAKEAEERDTEPETFPKFRFHDLRHTAASLMLLEGVSPKVVQERLGHSKIATTMDIYAHVMPTMQASAAEKIGRLLGAG